MECDTKAAPGRDNTNVIAGLIELCVLCGFARKLGDRTECASTPASFGIGQLSCQNLALLIGFHLVHRRAAVQSMAAFEFRIDLKITWNLTICRSGNRS